MYVKKYFCDKISVRTKEVDKNTFYIIELQEFDMRQQNQELTHVKLLRKQSELV